jgi:bifunctional DNase/RNase
LVELTLVGVRIELPTQTPIVLLKERDGERFLPIWIGNVEATAIAFALQGVATQRPLTHDLLKNLLDELVVSIERIVITELKEGTPSPSRSGPTRPSSPRRTCSARPPS